MLPTLVYRCTVPENPQGEVQVTCSVATQGKFTNGITTNADKSKILVVDILLKAVRVFTRLPTGQLNPEEIIPLPHYVDNIEYDAESDAFYLGSIPEGFDKHTKLVKHLREGKDVLSDHSFYAGSGVTRVKLVDGRWQVDDLIVHDGSLLSVVASGVSCCGGSKYLLGSWGDKGIL